MKFISCLSLLAWIPSVFSNDPDAVPLADPWDYQLMTVNSRFDGNRPVISLTYLMSALRSPPLNQGNDQMLIEVFGQDCDPTNRVPDNIFAVPPTIGPTRTNIAVLPGERAWDLDLELLTENLRFDGTQDAFLLGTADDFRLRLCVRTDMINLQGGANQQISFDETNVIVDIQLTANLGPIAIEARADLRDELTDNNDQLIDVIACQCNAALQCVNEEIHPNHNVRVCVSSPAALFEVLAIDTLTVTQQGEGSITVMQNRNPNGIFAVDAAFANTPDGVMAIVQFPGLTQFFEGKDNPVPPLVIAGEASMKFVDSNIQPRGNGLRQLQDDVSIAGKGEFEFSVELDPTPASASKFMGVLALVSTLVGTIFLL